MTDALLVAHVEEGAHMAAESTLNRAVQLTWWPTQRQDVADFCAACPGCKSKLGPPKPHRQPWHQPMLQSRKGEVLYLDTVGPLHRAEGGEVYIFTTMDGFTRYATATAVPDKKASTMAACLRAYVNTWGAPEKIFCDRGKELDNEEMRKAAESLRIERSFSLPYLPRQNKVERMHRTIGPLLKAVLAENNDHDNWPRYLPEILIGYNTSVHSVTGFTPQRLQTGSEYPGPLVRWVNPPVLEEEEDMATRMIRETREATVRNLRALTNQRVYQRRQSSLYQSTSPTFIPKVGDKVYFFCPVAVKLLSKRGYIAKKLASQWTGPWLVREKISELVFRIESINITPMKERVTTADRLDKYREGIALNNQATSNVLDERHPLTWMAEDDEFAEQIDNTATYFDEQAEEIHQQAVGKSGGWVSDTFDEIEVKLATPNENAARMEVHDEVEAEAEAEEVPEEREAMETEENSREVEKQEEPAARNVQTQEERAAAQGAVPKRKPDPTNLQGKRGEERWRLRVRMRNPAGRTSSESPARASANRLLREARAKERESSLATRRGTGETSEKKTPEEETEETRGSGGEGGEAGQQP